MINKFFNRSKTANPLNNAALSQKELYQKLYDYYSNNGLYDGFQANAYYSNSWVEAIKPLRTVVNRSVEFYVSKILPGESVKVTADNQSVQQAIEQVFKWSNFPAQKQVAIRYMCLYGNLFFKVANDETKVFYEIIEPKFVTDFKTDTRGYITEIRLDIPIVSEDGKNLTHTEYWNKEYYAIWEHHLGENRPLEQLGDPKDTSFLAELGIDFVPFVHIKFRDTGGKLGWGCTYHALDKIDESNREATRLTQLLFRYNKPYWIVSANDKDAQGRPIPAPKIKSSSVNAEQTEMEVKDNSITYMPGVSKIDSLIPQIDYASALSILNAMMDELEKDLPELRYYSLKDNQLSGKAIRLVLAGAIDRAEEARGNFLQGLMRLNQMALTIGEFWGFFSGIGSYENGDFEHSINAPDMFPSTLDEKAATLKIFVEAGLPLASAMRFSGYSEEEIQQAQQEKEQQDTASQNALANSLMNFNKG